MLRPELQKLLDSDSVLYCRDSPDCVEKVEAWQRSIRGIGEENPCAWQIQLYSGSLMQHCLMASDFPPEMPLPPFPLLSPRQLMLDAPGDDSDEPSIGSDVTTLRKLAQTYSDLGLGKVEQLAALDKFKAQAMSVWSDACKNADTERQALRDRVRGLPRS